MALFFITYDLRNSRDYQTLYDELANFNSVRMLESTWCFNRINTNSSGLRDHFKKFVDSDDGLIVSEIKNWASLNVDSTPKEL